MENKQERFATSQTRNNLMRAFAGESQARNRYTMAAGMAQRQEQRVLSDLFLFTAEQEKAHAALFYYALGEFSGQTIAADGTYPVDLYPDLLSHLKAAAHNEYQEWQEDYARFSAIAVEEDFPLVAKLFASVADVERVHGDRFARYAKLVEENRLFQEEEHTQWMCLHCGLVVESTVAPAHCPLCRAPQGNFLRREENPWR